MAVDVPDLKDDSMDGEAKEDELDESNGVDSDAGGSPVLVLASRLQTGKRFSMKLAKNPHRKHEILHKVQECDSVKRGMNN